MLGIGTAKEPGVAWGGRRDPQHQRVAVLVAPVKEPHLTVWN